jgi:hypothetical protein
VRKFGPYRTWECESSPGHGKDEEYREFCNRMHEILGTTMGMQGRAQGRQGRQHLAARSDDRAVSHAEVASVNST